MKVDTEFCDLYNLLSLIDEYSNIMDIALSDSGDVIPSNAR